MRLCGLLNEFTMLLLALNYFYIPYILYYQFLHAIYVLYKLWHPTRGLASRDGYLVWKDWGKKTAVHAVVGSIVQA